VSSGYDKDLFPMSLAKPRIDIGLAARDLAPMLSFWQGQVGAVFDHVLKVRRGQDQHRHDIAGSVLKINHSDAPPPASPPSGYRELVVARAGVAAPLALTDPEGNRVTLAPPGREGVTQIAVRLGVRSLKAHRHFYGAVLGLPEARPGVFQAGESLIFLEERDDAPSDAEMRGSGWRYITFQVFKVDAAHAGVLARGGREGLAPVTLGSTARVSAVCDPDGNWIELSQRASITGSLEP
jgi:catechol 2,3-dioxygenase-like lactoylglutathione lyase family enzyme